MNDQSDWIDDSMNSKSSNNDSDSVDIIALSDEEDRNECHQQHNSSLSKTGNIIDLFSNTHDSISLYFDTIHIGSVINTSLQPAEIVLTNTMLKFSLTVSSHNSVSCKFLYTDLVFVVAHMSPNLCTLIVFIDDHLQKMIRESIFPLLLTTRFSDTMTSTYQAIVFTSERERYKTDSITFQRQSDICISRLTTILKNKIKVHVVNEDKARNILSRLTYINTSALDLQQTNERNNSAQLVLIYPKSGSNRISIKSDDLRCLVGNAFLNDVIIGFYCRYLYNEVLTEREKKIYHIFDSIFFDKLMTTNAQIATKPDTKEERFQNLKKWIKNLNLSEKHFLFFPANQNFHWFLVIMCFPCMLFENSTARDDLNEYVGNKPMLLILDSLNQYEVSSHSIDRWKTNNGSVLNTFQSTMNMFIQCFTGISDDFPPLYELRVPKQSNYTDCGLFVLEYLKEFIRENPLKTLTDPPPDLSCWFNPLNIECTRSHIQQLIEKQVSTDD